MITEIGYRRKKNLCSAYLERKLKLESDLEILYKELFALEDSLIKCCSNIYKEEINMEIQEIRIKINKIDINLYMLNSLKNTIEHIIYT